MVSTTEFFFRLAPIVTDKLYIGTDLNHLDTELRQNTWRISASEAERETISIDDFVAFVDSVVRNRLDQLQQDCEAHRMLFYMWFDVQASQLRFSVISDIHEKLPFTAKTNIVSDPRIIIGEFLGSTPLISWEELEVKDYVRGDPADEMPEYLLDVYVVALTVS